MWDWDWQPVEDYGARYDHGVITILPVSMRAFGVLNQRQPALGWLAYRRGEQVGALPPRTTIIGQRYRDRLPGASGQINLTRGCAAACWAIEQPDCGEVVLIGFDNLRAGRCAPVEQAFPAA